MIGTLEHPQRGAFMMPSCPVQLSDSPAEPKIAPLLGQHTEEVLKDLLGFGEEEAGRTEGATSFRLTGPCYPPAAPVPNVNAQIFPTRITNRAINPGFIVHFKLHRKLNGPGPLGHIFQLPAPPRMVMISISPHRHVPLPYRLTQFPEKRAATNEDCGSSDFFANCPLAPTGACESKAAI